MEKLNKIYAWLLDCLENSKMTKETTAETKMRKIELQNELDKILSMPNDANVNEEGIDLQSLKLAERVKQYVK